MLRKTGGLIMSKHTKGPWETGPICMVETKFTGPYINVTTTGKGWADKQPAIVAGATEEETIANAYLIASAPEMLEALKAVKHILLRYDPQFKHNIGIIDKVLAKAENRKPEREVRE